MNVVEFLKREGLYGKVETAATKLHLDTMKVEDHLRSFRLVWNSRAKRRYGLCRYGVRREIELSTLLMKPELADEKELTAYHEAAHAIDYMIRGRSNHDYHWQRVMLALGQQPNRCGNSEIFRQETAKRAKHIYCCERCGYEVPAFKRWRRAKIHSRCGGMMVMKGSKPSQTLSPQGVETVQKIREYAWVQKLNLPSKEEKITPSHNYVCDMCGEKKQVDSNSPAKYISHERCKKGDGIFELQGEN